uniref:Uncharacterized protein n=1 Tax=Salmonella sp. 96A-29192 TaxID=1179814 RepID=I3VZN7_9ENTR|nr:hypothetical protein [Salmonella sp. 96A-29192]
MHRSPNKVSRGNKQNIARLFLLESPPPGSTLFVKVEEKEQTV